MKIRKSQLNGLLVYGVLPYTMIFGVTYLSYILVFYYMLFQGAIFRNSLILILSITFTGVYVYYGPHSKTLSDPYLLASINTSLALSLLLLSPFVKINSKFSSSVYSDFLILVFIVVCLVNKMLGNTLGFNGDALLQIGGFTFVLYYVCVGKSPQLIKFFIAAIVSGGRSIIAGAFYGLLMGKYRQLHYWITLVLLITLLILLFSGMLVTFFQDYLQGLSDQGILLKGRTGFWLAVLGNNFTFWGHGAGTSLQTMIETFGIAHQPHNDYARIYTDFGSLLFATLLFILRKNSLESFNGLFSSSVLALFLATGNPLSFATAISAYLMVVTATGKRPDIKR